MGILGGKGSHKDPGRIGKGGKQKAIGKHSKPTHGKHGKPAKGSGKRTDERDGYKDGDNGKGGAADGLDRWG